MKTEYKLWQIIKNKKCGVSTIITEENKMKKITIIQTVLIATINTVNDKLFRSRKPNKEKWKILYLYSMISLLLMLLLTGCMSPLLTSVNKNNTKEAETLINNGADVNKKSLGATPLYAAVYRNNPEIVGLLLDKGADVNENVIGGWRPIHIAVKNGNAEIVKLLIEKGVDINVPHPYGKTPLTVAQENGYTVIVSLLNGEEVMLNEDFALKSDMTTANVADNNPKVTVPVVNNDNGQNSKKEKVFIPSLRIVKPIPTIIGNVVVSEKYMSSSMNAKDYNISSWGFGVGVDAKVYKDFRLFFDMTGYSFKQELVQEGGTGYVSIGMGSNMSFPDGMKYKTYTTAMRLGVKYVYSKSQKFQPWIGVAYGLNVWNVKYVTWNEDEVYGKAKGTTWRLSILFGIDLKLKDVATFTFFFDAISPVASYTMENLFGLGDYRPFDATTFPTPRIGISIGGF